MSGVELRTIADYQLAIQQLDRNNPADRAKIAEYTAKIGELLKGEGKVQTTGGALNISEEMGFVQNNHTADIEDVQAMSEFSREGAGSKREARAVINEEFGAGYDKETHRAKKRELREAKRELRDLQREARKLEFDPNNPEAYNTEYRALQSQIAEQTRVVQGLEQEVTELNALKRGSSRTFARRFERAAHQNVEQYQETMEVLRVFVSEEQAEAFIAEHPELEDNVNVASKDDMEALTKLHMKGEQAIAEAEASGDEAAIAAAHEKYDAYVNIFGKTADGETDYTKINVQNVQDILVDLSGSDQNFNIDETKVLAAGLDMKKSDVEDLAETFGFGHENRYSAKWRAAGIAAGAALAGNVINTLLGNTHSHQRAEASATAQGETVQGEVSWLANNGQEFYHFYEARGGEAACSVVAEACAKIPLVGQLAGPALAGVTAFLLTKGQPEDLFNGANTEAVLENIQAADKDAQPVLLQIKEMVITGDPKVDNAIKAAVIKASIGEDTKACNLRELSKAYVDLRNTKDKIQAIEEYVEPEPVVEPEPEPEPEPVVVPPKPQVDYDVRQEPDKEVRTEIPRLKLREGTWYTSHAYVADDGSNLTEAERKQVQRLLTQEANRIAIVDTNNDGKTNFRDQKVSLPTELELPNGKKVKVAPDAFERIMKLPATGGGADGKYGVHVAKINGKWNVVDPSQGDRIIAGPFDTEAQARAEERRLEDEANNPS